MALIGADLAYFPAARGFRNSDILRDMSSSNVSRVSSSEVSKPAKMAASCTLPSWSNLSSTGCAAGVRGK